MKYILLLPAAILTVLVCLLPPALASGTDQQSADATVRTISPQTVQAVQPVFKSISPTVAAELLSQKEDMLIVDVRTPQERKQFRIANSLLVPVGDVMRGRFRPEPDTPILLVCAVGGRSYVAGRVMNAMGHPEVYNLKGGIESWRKAGLPIDTGPENHANQ